jgi:sterol desaturase/sphingolipid hydroxylase (fatty acid hydroxylase superfamily)
MPHLRSMRHPRPSLPIGPILAVAALAGVMVLEHRAPLRRATQREPARTGRNLMLGLLSMAVVAAAEGPLVDRLAETVERRRWGLAQRVRAPAWLRDALAVLGMDYTMYVWHVLTHKLPFLWRFHLVHHVDLDLDSSTAMRFHAVDMLISIPWRAAQMLLLGTSRRALSVWQGFFFASVVFHHSNMRLPPRLERAMATVLTTPRMHGIHHSAMRDHTDSNWSSGFSIWDHLHRTFRLDVPQRAIRIGVPGYREPAELRLWPSLILPFRRQRDAWQPPGGNIRNGAGTVPGWIG